MVAAGLAALQGQVVAAVVLERRRGVVCEDAALCEGRSVSGYSDFDRDFFGGATSSTVLTLWLPEVACACILQMYEELSRCDIFAVHSLLQVV